MDEAVLRIVLQDAAKGSSPSLPGAGASTSAGSSAAGYQPPPTPPSASRAAVVDMGGQHPSDILKGAWDDLFKFEDEMRKAKEDKEREANDAAIAALDRQIEMHDMAMDIIAGAEDHLKAFQKEEEARIRAGADAQVDMQEYAREILQGAEEDLKKFQESKKDGGFGKILDVIGNFRGTIGGAAGMAVGGGLDIMSAAGAGGAGAAVAAGPLGLAAIAAVGLAKSFTTLTRELDIAARHYEQYNVQIAMASAQADVRRTMRDIERGNVLGPNLSQYVSARSKLENNIEDIKTHLLNALLPYVNTIADLMAKSSDLLAKIAPASASTVQTLIETRYPMLRTLRQIYDSMPKEDKNIQDPTTLLFNMQEPLTDAL